MHRRLVPMRRHAARFFRGVTLREVLVSVSLLAGGGAALHHSEGEAGESRTAILEAATAQTVGLEYEIAELRGQVKQLRRDLHLKPARAVAPEGKSLQPGTLRASIAASGLWPWNWGKRQGG